MGIAEALAFEELSAPQTWKADPLGFELRRLAADASDKAEIRSGFERAGSGEVNPGPGSSANTQRPTGSGSKAPDPDSLGGTRPFGQTRIIESPEGHSRVTKGARGWVIKRQ